MRDREGVVEMEGPRRTRSIGEIGGGLRSDGGDEKERQRKKLCSAGRWHGYRSCAESEEGWERKEKRNSAKGTFERGTGEEEEVEVVEEGEPEKDTLSHSTVRYCRVFPVTVAY
jgi:hypothetical protein